MGNYNLECLRMNACMCEKSPQLCLTLCDPMDHSLLCPWDSPNKNTRVGCHALLQGIFPTQGSNLCLLHLLHWQADSLPWYHLGSQYLLGIMKKKACFLSPGWGGVLGVSRVFPVNFILNLKYVFSTELCSPFILEPNISPSILLHFGSSVSWCL